MAMIDVTVVLLEEGLPTTSLAPLEIFACAGMLFPMLVGATGEPRFRVRTATIDGKPTKNFVPVTVEPTMSLAQVKKTDPSSSRPPGWISTPRASGTPA
jgi:hypothetical protein